jgi:radical SAM superfamily enzyme YgiQ (UPF0313 family)
MKVLLINPPSVQHYADNSPEIIAENRGLNPPLGLLYLASYLEERTSHRVEVIDCQAENCSLDGLRRKVKAADPDVVGISVMTMTLMDALATAKTVKSASRTIKVVFGGPHVHLFPAETIAFGEVDYLVMGEGEKSFAELVSRMEDQSAIQDIPGLVFKDKNEIIQTGQPDLIEDLDSLPFPARHLSPYRKYNSLLAAREPVTTMFTSRGCPFKCTFCDRPHLGKKFRARSPENVVNEIEHCINMGIHDFMIYDDTFTVIHQRVMEICEMIINRKLDISFDIRARVDTVNETMLDRLAGAGCRGIHYGIEAGTEKVLNVLNKGIDLDTAARVFKATKRRNIPVLAYFMIGSPTETVEDIKKTFSLMKKLDPDYVHLTMLTPFPGTEIYKAALQQGIVPHDVWKEYAADPVTDFQPPFWNEYFSLEELQDLTKQGYREFYLRPRHIAKQLAKMRSFSEFRRKARAGMNIIKSKRASKHPVVVKIK